MPVNCHVFDGGIVWSSGNIEEWWTYKRLAFLPYKTAQLRVGIDCTDELRPLVEAEAAKVMAEMVEA